jgi:hypothetical protein
MVPRYAAALAERWAHVDWIAVKVVGWIVAHASTDASDEIGAASIAGRSTSDANIPSERGRHLERLSGLSSCEAITCLPAAEGGALKARHAARGKSPKRKVRALTRLS